MSFSISGPINYTLNRNWYSYTNTSLSGSAGYLSKDSLRAWWRLDSNVSASGAEGLDSSGYGHTLTAAADANRPTFDSGDTPSSKIQASSLLFATDDFLTAADSNSLSFGDSTGDDPFSVSFWVKPTTLGGSEQNQGIVTKWHTTGTNAEYAIYIKSEKIRFELYSEGNSAIIARRKTASDIFTAGVWTHIVCTYDGSAGSAASSGMSIYVNGILADSTPTTTGAYVAMSNTTAPVALGNLASGENTTDLHGNLIDVAIWAKELAATDAAALYNISLYGAFANYRNWFTKKSTATPGTRVSATYQGINIESTVSASADSFALGVLPFAHVQHKQTSFFRGNDRLFVNNFDDSVSIPIQTFVPRRELQKKAASITVTKHPGLYAANSAGVTQAGRYVIPDTRGQFARTVMFSPDINSTTPTLFQQQSQVFYGIQGIAENDTIGIAKRLYEAIDAAISASPSQLVLNAHYNTGTSTIYLTLKDFDALSGVGFDSTTIRGSAINGTPINDNGGYSDPTAYAEDFAANLVDQLPLPFGDQRNIESTGIMSQEEYSTPFDLASPKWTFGLGESPQYDDTGAFHDGGDFDPVFYLTYSGSSAMWPVNLINAGLMQGRLFDGVLECFDIRREVTFDLDLRFDGRTIRGEVQGAFGSNYLGSTEIVTHERITDKHNAPFLDACELFANIPSTESGATAQIAILSSDVSKDYTPESKGRFALKDSTGFQVVFEPEQDYEQPARGTGRFIDPDTGRRWLWQYGISGVSSKSNIAERITAAINQANLLGDIRISASQDSELVNLTQDLPGNAGNTEIYGPAITKDTIGIKSNFTGGASSLGVGAVTATGAPAYGYFSTVNRFPISDDGEVMDDQGLVPQPFLYHPDVTKTTTNWLPSKNVGTHYFSLKNNIIAPFIERVYVEQFYQPIFVHNDGNTPILDPIISAVTNLSSSIYPSAYNSTTNKWELPQAPFKNDNWVGIKGRQHTPDMPQTYGATGFYYSRKPDSIVFGDL